jgi:hypothetical protein
MPISGKIEAAAGLPLRRSKVLKKNGFIVVLSLLIVACISEVKPILKPTEVDIPTRIANEQRWVDEAVRSKAITVDDARLVQAKLYEIKEKYNRLELAGRLSVKDTDMMNKMLDECSEMLFRKQEMKRKAP